MKPFTSFLYALASQALVIEALVHRNFEKAPITRRDLSSDQVQRELGGQLSGNSSIYGPEDPRYAGAISRWNKIATPEFQIIVVPGEESDVSTIVKYCHDNSIEFLIQNRKHGWTRTLSTFKGITISMENLRHIDIQPSGKTAWFGGGAFGGEVSQFLWDRGYVATHGSCDCVGLLGPGLGGGHGRHEGLYGLVSDNIRQINLVLANGTEILVSKTSHADLFWALQGAGHNFGAVTSFEMNIWPRGPNTWHYHNYVWRGDKLETVFDALNTFHGNGSTPVNMAVNFGFFAINSSITESEPVMSWTFAYRGSAAEAEVHLAPFNAIPNAYEETGDIPFPRISAAQGSSACPPDQFIIDGTVGLQVYNLTAERLLWDGFQKRIDENLELARGGSIIHEGYSNAAVRNVNPDDSAFPHRADNHPNLISVRFDPESGLEDAASEWVREVVDQWNAGQPERLPSVYVNYAHGVESLKDIYGHEEWRLERLRKLKAQYDPENKFRYYNPIVQASGSK